VDRSLLLSLVKASAVTISRPLLDVIYSMYQAVLETGVTGDMDASEICEQLKTGYTSMTFDGLTGTGMTWDASGAVSKDPKAVVIKDGAYAAM